MRPLGVGPAIRIPAETRFMEVDVLWRASVRNYLMNGGVPVPLRSQRYR